MLDMKTLCTEDLHHRSARRAWLMRACRENRCTNAFSASLMTTAWQPPMQPLAEAHRLPSRSPHLSMGHLNRLYSMTIWN